MSESVRAIRGERDQRPPWVLAALVGGLVLSIYLLTGSNDLRHNGDTELRYQTAQAIVDHGRLWIAHPAATGTRIAVGLGGHFYVSAYGPGQSIFMVPLYWAGRMLSRLFDLPWAIVTEYTSRSLDLFLGAALAFVFFLMTWSMGYGRRAAVALTLVFAFATAAWPDAQSALEHTQVSLFLLLSVFATWRFVQSECQRRLWLLLAGTASGLTIFTRYDAVIYMPVLVLWLVILRWRSERRGELVGDAIAYGLGVLPWVCFLMLWNQLRFGSPFNVALHLKTFGEPPWIGLPGLLVSPGKGIIWYVPLLFLLPWAAPRQYRRLPGLALVFSALVVIALGFYANVLYWHGDPAWGPRYLYPVLPYLILPLGEMLSRWRREIFSLRAVAVALIALSVGIQVAAVSVNIWRFWYRLEATQEHTSHKFNWGPTEYTYYSTPSESPILIQIQDVYDVVRIDAFGDTQYRLTKRPTHCTGPTHCLDNPARNYPLNTLAYWWADIRHPIFDARTRAAIALALVLIAGGMSVGIGQSLRRDDDLRSATSSREQLQTGESHVGAVCEN